MPSPTLNLLAALLLGVFTPSAGTDMDSLERALTARSPQLTAEQLDAAEASAALLRARTLDNPLLDLSVGNVPFGSTNPTDLCNGLGARCAPSEIMNYGVGLSYRFELGKRGHRQRREAAALEASQATLEFSTRLRALDLARLLGRLSLIVMRRAASNDVLDAARAFTKLSADRAAQGFLAPMELDRLELDNVRLENALLSDEAEEQAALAQCSAMLATACTSFDSASSAREFMERWLALATDRATRGERADLRALGASIRAAQADAELARMTTLPDPTLSVSYLHDRFLVSGNQMNAISVGLSLPLPLFDRGQASVQAATARAETLERQRLLLSDATTQTIDALERMLRRQAERRSTIRERMLPKAQALAANLEKAVAARALPLSELQQARRTLFELMQAEADALFDGFNAKLDLLATLAAPTITQPRGTPTP